MTATITVIGNLTSDPELRYTSSGLAVANFTVASTEKVFDKKTNEFKDGKTLFMRCSVWREFAEQVAGSLTKGNRVIVVGKIATREYETAAGEKRSSIELDVDAIGPDLRYATAQVTRVTRTGSPASGQGGTNTAPGDSGTSSEVSGAYSADSQNWGSSDVPF